MGVDVDRWHHTETTSSAKGTEAFAASLARRLRAPLVLCLDGPLGAGKTTFVRGLVGGLFAANGGTTAPLVQSPTYALMRRYQTTPPVFHLDLYRLHETGADVDDQLEALGLLEQLDDGLTLVEWAPPGTHWPVPSGVVRVEAPSARRRVITLDLPAGARTD